MGPFSVARTEAVSLRHIPLLSGHPCRAGFLCLHRTTVEARARRRFADASTGALFPPFRGCYPRCESLIARGQADRARVGLVGTRWRRLSKCLIGRTDLFAACAPAPGVERYRSFWHDRGYCGPRRSTGANARGKTTNCGGTSRRSGLGRVKTRHWSSRENGRRKPAQAVNCTADWLRGACPRNC